MRGTVEAHVRREVVSPVEERVVAVGVRNADLVLLPQFGKARPVVQARAVGGLLVGHLRGNPQPAIGAKRTADVALDPRPVAIACRILAVAGHHLARSEEHTSELQSLMRNSYAVFCLYTNIIQPSDYTTNTIN